MDFIQRLALLVLLSIGALMPNHANAGTFTPPIKYHISSTYGGGESSSVQQLCIDVQEKVRLKHYPNEPFIGIQSCSQQTSIGSDAQTSYNPISAMYKRNYGAFAGGYTVGSAAMSCPAGTTRNGHIPNVTCTDSCVLPNVFNQSTGSCGPPPPPPCNAGDVVSSGFYDMGKDPNAAYSATACEAGCQVQFEGTAPATQSEQGDGIHYYAKGYYEKSGLTCSSGSPAPSAFPKTPPSVDDQARAEAEANAKAAAEAKAAADKVAADAKAAADKAAAAAAAADAYAKKAAADKAAAAAKAAADKAAAAAAAAAATEADPNATQAEKDSAAAASTAAAAAASTAAAAEASATTAASTAAGQAAATAKDEAPEKAKDFCETNAHLQVCKNSSINDGFCSNGQLTGFSCSGDAVNCNQAETLARQYCATTQTDTALISKFTEAQNDNGANNPASLAKRSIINLPSSLDASSPYAATCNGDTTISVGGSTVTLPFSSWCPVLISLGYLFLACAYISAALILGGSV